MSSQDIEIQIRELLGNEKNCGTLSSRLFGPQGLFALLGPTREDRQRVGMSPLFKEAQKRLRELEREQAELFRQQVKQLPLGRSRAK